MLTENHINFLLCLSSYLNQDKIKTEQDLGACASILDCDDYRQAYLKARWLMSNGAETEDNTKIIQALGEVERALELKLHDNKFNLNEIPSNYVSLLNPKAIFEFVIPLAKIYTLGGQIAAMIDDYDKSLKYYQQFHFQTFSSSFNAQHQRLFLFRKCNEYTFKDLINNRLSLIRPNKLNDPFDCLVFPWREQLQDRCEEKKHVASLFKSYDYYRIRSFVLGNNKKPLYKDCVANKLMWSHYADEHKGICIQYDFSENILQNNDNRQSRFMLVRYAKKDESIDVNKNTISVHEGFATKSSDWKYENEVRLISYDISSQEDFTYLDLDVDSKIKAVFFGLRCSEDSIQTIKKIIGDNCGYYKMVKNYRNIYSLDVVPI